MRLEERMQAILEGRLPGKGVLWLLSLLYQMGVRMRHWAYQYRLAVPKKVSAVVVSVGNIVAGGSGKTPLVHLLAEELAEKNKVAILSRGYRSRAEHQKQPQRVTSSALAEEVGDEPLWLARKLPQVQVWVGKDRVASAQMAIAHGAEIVILDDGFQHLRLHRDFEVVTISGEAPYSNGYFLPRGYLRDLPERLSGASVLAVMGSERLSLPAKQVLFSRKQPLSLQGKKVALFCAIANPERFLKTVQEAGAHVTVSYYKPDHDAFAPQELEDLAQKSKADLLVCTEKDHVKLAHEPRSIPILPIPLELSITQGEGIWQELLSKIQSQVHYERISSHAS